MTQYDWSNIPAGVSVASVATRRLVTEAETLLGVSFAADELQIAAIAELLAQFQYSQQNQILGNPGFQRASNFDVNNATAVTYLYNGVLKTFAATTTFDTGTTKTLASSRWGAATLAVNGSNGAVLTWAPDDYASEAAAIAALAAPVAANRLLGYVTVQAHSSGFTAGTDALNGGSGGNVAAATNYYNRPQLP